MARLVRTPDPLIHYKAANYSDPLRYWDDDRLTPVYSFKADSYNVQRLVRTGYRMVTNNAKLFRL
jgi:hypothetical protein